MSLACAFGRSRCPNGSVCVFIGLRGTMRKGLQPPQLASSTASATGAGACRSCPCCACSPICWRREWSAWRELALLLNVVLQRRARCESHRPGRHERYLLHGRCQHQGNFEQKMLRVTSMSSRMTTPASWVRLRVVSRA